MQKRQLPNGAYFLPFGSSRSGPTKRLSAQELKRKFFLFDRSQHCYPALRLDSSARSSPPVEANFIAKFSCCFFYRIVFAFADEHNELLKPVLDNLKAGSSRLFSVMNKL